MKISLLTGVILVFTSSFSYCQDIFEASRKGNLEAIKKMKQINSDTLNAVNNSGYTPLIIAGYRNQMEVVKYLLESGVEVNKNAGEGTALMGACYKGNVELVKLLLKYKADVNAVNEKGTTALMFAVLIQNEELVKILLDNGANKEARETSGKTVRDYANKGENINIQTLLK